MQILSIETSDRTGSVALIVDKQLAVEIQLPSAQRTAQSLAPAVAKLLEQSGGAPEAIAVSVGPGSFTGLRVGIATAKTLAWAWKIPVVGISTLETIGAQAIPHIRSFGEATFPLRLSVASNAYRSQVFACDARVESDGSVDWSASSAIDYAQWLEHLTELADFVTGPALSLRRTADQEVQLDRVATIPESEWAARAGTVGVLGAERFEAGLTQSPESLLPDYGRVSAAEEKMS